MRRTLLPSDAQEVRPASSFQLPSIATFSLFVECLGEHTDLLLESHRENADEIEAPALYQVREAANCRMWDAVIAIADAWALSLVGDAIAAAETRARKDTTR